MRKRAGANIKKMSLFGETFSKKPSKSAKDKKIINDMAKSILKIIIAENKKHIQKWIDCEFEKKLSGCVEKFVESEFKEEILPVLKEHIDAKMVSIRLVTKQQVKECIKEVFTEALDKLTEEYTA